MTTVVADLGHVRDRASLLTSRSVGLLMRCAAPEDFAKVVAWASKTAAWKDVANLVSCLPASLPEGPASACRDELLRQHPLAVLRAIEALRYSRVSFTTDAITVLFSAAAPGMLTRVMAWAQ
jgi:hypothetical protein